MPFFYRNPIRIVSHSHFSRNRRVNSVSTGGPNLSSSLCIRLLMFFIMTHSAVRTRTDAGVAGSCTPELIASYGYWLSFHDAEVLHLELHETATR